MLYLIYAESAYYAGYGQHFVVKAESEDEARDLAENDVNDYFYEQDYDQLLEDGHLDEDDVLTGEAPGRIVSCGLFDEEHECWAYYLQPDQAEFYIPVNFSREKFLKRYD